MSSCGRASKYRYRDWAQLPDGPLDDIICRFNKLRDVIRFQAVCKPWRQATLPQTPKFRQSLPWLMRPCGESSSRGPSCYRFIDATAAAAGGNNAVVSGHINVAGDNPSTYGHLSSTFGWLLRATKQQHTLFLLNPFTGTQIPLPPLEKELQGGGGDQHSKRRLDVIVFGMSAEPTTTKGCIVMVSYSEGKRYHYGLAVCEIGDRQWRFIALPEDEQIKVRELTDIVFWRGKFHAFGRWGDILVFDNCGFSWAFRPLIGLKGSIWSRSTHLSVSPERELMLVVRTVRPGLKQSDKFEVYRIDADGNRWVEIVSIGDYALFIDNYNTSYVSVQDHPECKRNCVYYHKGIFDLDGTQKNDSFFDFCDSGLVLANAFWILPSNY